MPRSPVAAGPVWTRPASSSWLHPLLPRLRLPLVHPRLLDPSPPMEGRGGGHVHYFQPNLHM